MTSPISGTTQLVRIIRAQLARPSSASGQRPAVSPSGASATDQQLAELIALRVRGIALDDPARGRKAFRVFLEAILLSQFGQPLANDPKFHQLVSDVQREMEENPTIGPLVARAVAHLLSQQTKGD